ncbi:ribonuclease HIII [Mycoplasmopsis opalescens]|uniref:ribonuclease HIII n=1 Tax=Mycoplasmopsis opalescens TaxID=114886 RepID=UPI0004A70555|nr:ribonuclease HIII [Mycoplasmopsis opalescens]
MQFLTDLNLEYNDLDLIGTDECGVGDFYGPLVACAVFIPKENMSFIKDLGVKDSKLITNSKKIKEIAKQLRKMVKYSIKIFNPEGYNKLNKYYNSNQLKMFLHMFAINELEANVKKIDYIIIDQFSTLKSIQKYYDTALSDQFLNIQKFQHNVILTYKAEQKSLAVSCASILARDKFLYKIEELNREYNTQFPLGASNLVKEFHASFLKKNKNISLNKIAKLHFNMEIKDNNKEKNNLFE